MMQLCAIPDDVVQKLHFNNEWGSDLHNYMDQYKKGFPMEHGKVWEFSNEDNLQAYLKFKEDNGSFQRTEDYLLAKEDIKKEYWNRKSSRSSGLNLQRNRMKVKINQKMRAEIAQMFTERNRIKKKRAELRS